MNKGQIIRLFRIANDLSISQLSEISNCSKSYITELEKGKKNCSLKILTNIMKAMNSDVETFYQVKQRIEEINVENDFKRCLEIVLNVYL